MALNISLLLFAALALNIPFGYWRQGVPKLSALWFVAIHAPVPFIILLRLIWGVSISVLPLTIGFSLAGQILGGKLRLFILDRRQIPVK